MRSLVPSPAVLAPALLLLGLAACSRTDDRASDPAGGAVQTPAVTSQDAAPAAGGPRTLKPGLWKTVTQAPGGPEESTRCLAEGYDPGAEAARKVSPCGNPTVTRTADGFRLDHVCEKSNITYTLAGTVRGDFTTTAETNLELVVSAFGRKQTLHMKAVSTYQGPCEPGSETAQGAGRNPGKATGQ